MPMPATTLPRKSAKSGMSAYDLREVGDVLAFMEHRRDSRDNHRYEHERQWYINVAQYLGHQYHTWRDQTRNMILPKVPDWRVRIVANRLLPMARKTVSRFLRQRPSWVVVPATNDMEDRITAHLSTQVLRYYWRTLDMDAELVEAFTWLAVTGNVFMRAFWDGTKGGTITAKAEDFGRDGKKKINALAGRDGRRKPEALTVGLGDLNVEVRPPFAVDVDPGATRWSEVTHLIDTRIRPLSELQDEYPDKADEISKQETETGEDKLFEKMIQSLGSPNGLRSGTNNESNKDRVAVHELWVRPSRRYPKGIYAVVSGKAVLRHGDNPYAHKEIPYIHMQEIVVPGRFWGTCALEQSISLQAQYNRARSQSIENANLMSRPKWWVPKQSGVKHGSLTSEPGEWIEYIAPLKPEPVTPPQEPQYHGRNMELAVSDMQAVQSQHEVSHAQVPGGVRAGVAIAQLQEQDESVLAPSMMMAERSLSRLGAQALQLVAQFVKEERIAKIVGKDLEPDIFKFKGTDLVGGNKGQPGVNYFDVDVQLGSQIPLSFAARREEAIQYAQFGILNPQDPAHLEKLWEILQIGSMPGEPDAKSMDRANARRENNELEAGFSPEIQPWDEDEIHIEAHRLYQKQPQYHNLLKSLSPEEAQDLIARFEEHIQSHVERLAMRQGVVGPQQPPPEAEVSGQSLLPGGESIGAGQNVSTPVEF